MKNLVVDILRNNERFEIVTHEGPDEDAVGSSRALAFGLLSMGKKVKIVYPTPIPDSLLFTSAPKNQKDVKPQISLLLDVSDMNMLGGFHPRGEIVIVDHHKTDITAGMTCWIDPGKSSASEMVYDLLRALEIEITQAMASNLYLGIFGDTGGFIHVNTTPRVFRIAYELTRGGADPNLIAYRVRRSKSLTYYHLLSMVMDRMMINDGVYASYISLAELKRIKARPDDASGIVEEMASLAGAELVIFLKELNPDTVHCSMRSKTGQSALRTARAFGGGGHERAAGITLKGRASEKIEDVIEEGLKWVNKG
ncbi:MAG TPA: bifunctional oligoribonuclease/PAP phosphatase NrnA [Deltaproteobacteria bacterium]|nr:bifunctional oligoribonuclease/PAP phosphatase NrnA [Deltaproteobacteria bacterium]